MQRPRDTVKSLDAGTLVLVERSGATLTPVLAANFSVREVVPIELAAIQSRG